MPFAPFDLYFAIFTNNTAEKRILNHVYTVLTFISLIICWNSVPMTPPSRSKFISIVEIGAAAGWLQFVEQLELDQNRFGRLGLFIVCQIYTDSAAESMQINTLAGVLF